MTFYMLMIDINSLVTTGINMKEVIAINHSHKKQTGWKHRPNCPFYALMLRTKLY